MSEPDLNSEASKACLAAGLLCLSKDNGRTWKWGMADKDGWPGTDNAGWPWSEWEVDPQAALNKFNFLLARRVRS